MREYLALLKSIVIKKQWIYAQFGITHRCNLRCRMCNIWKLADKTEELSITQINILADILKSLGIVIISLGGGEPFLREDLRDIMKIFLKRGFRVRLLTNGTLVKEDVLKDFVKLGLRDISISLDTLSSKKQSYICQQEGTWDRIIDSMILISKLFPKRGSLLLVNTTVSRLNIEELPSLARFASKLGYYISYIPLEPIAVRHPCPYTEDYYPEFKIGPDEYRVVDMVYDELIMMKRKNYNIFNSTRFLEDSRHFLKTSQMNWECHAGRLYFSIDPKGDLSVCHRFHSKQKKSYDDLGFKLDLLEDIKKEQQELVEECPGCMRPCWAEITNLVRDKRSLWEMFKIDLSTYRRRR